MLLLLSACPTDPGGQRSGEANQSDESAVASEIPASGEYVYDVAFAEYQGASMGKTVKVIIDGHKVQVIFDGNEVDNGQLMKHKTGVWIIAINESDKELDEVGGCTDGPSIIDFANKKYWMC
ncbi:MAG: hypothetical protein AAFQ94_25510 [Bacteroidota bacterium]